MNCNTDKTAQVLTDKKDSPIERNVTLFLRYPHDQRDKIDSAAVDAATVDAQRYINEYNETHEQEVVFDSVKITKITGDSDTHVGGDNVSHWQFKGEATYETFVTCR